MPFDVVTYRLEVVLEYTDGKFSAYYLKATSPRSDFLFPRETSSDDLLIRPSERSVVDWVRGTIHEISETEWFNTR